MAEGDVSYEDALEMVGLKKPDGHSAFGGYQTGDFKDDAIHDGGPEVKVGGHDSPSGYELDVEAGERDAQRRGVGQEKKEVNADDREAEVKAGGHEVKVEVDSREEEVNAGRNDAVGGHEVEVKPENKGADEEEKVAEINESKEKKNPFIRRAKTTNVKKRKHAGDFFLYASTSSHLPNHKSHAPIPHRSCACLDPHRRRNRPGNPAIGGYERLVCCCVRSLLCAFA